MSHLKKKHIIEGTLVTVRKMLELQEYKARIVFILDLRKSNMYTESKNISINNNYRLE